MVRTMERSNKKKNDELLSDNVYHFFLCSSIDTPPGPKETIINKPPITERV